MEYECGESHLWKDSAYYEEVDKRQGQRNIGDGFIRAEFIDARHYEWYIFVSLYPNIIIRSFVDTRSETDHIFID